MFIHANGVQQHSLRLQRQSLTQMTALRKPQMEIYARSNQRHSRAGGYPAALGSRLRGNDGMPFPSARLAPGLVIERRWRWERKVR